MRTRDPQRAVAVIPARHASTRFPGKPLARETGKYLIEHVWERVKGAAGLERVIVATDDERIAAACAAFGAECAMTSTDCANGTERCAEVALRLDCDVVVNVQGDEPEMDPGNIDVLLALMAESAALDGPRIGTLAVRDSTATAEGRARFLSPHVVKVVRDRAHRALYFSRAPIPHDRDHGGVPETFLRHLGMYAYERRFLCARGDAIGETRRSTRQSLAEAGNGGRLDRIESLEQLRWLEQGLAIAVGDAVAECEGIDTPEQYARFVARWKARPA